MSTATPLDLSGFTGTENWYRHWANPKITFTDGAHHFAEHAGNGAFWFLDIIVTELTGLQRELGFLHIVLNVIENEADITADDGNNNIVWQKHISYTDCPPGTYRFYFTNDVILLTTEY